MYKQLSSGQLQLQLQKYQLQLQLLSNQNFYITPLLALLSAGTGIYCWKLNTELKYS